jgi:ankyrin repeat protein
VLVRTDAIMSTSIDLRLWIQNASTEEFTRRVNDEPGFLDFRDSSGDRFGAMHHAAALGRIDLIRMILERGVSVDTPSGTPEEYPDPEAERAKFEPGFTPLMCAAAHGQLATARHLIAVGADPFRADYYDGTALHSAAASGSPPIVNVLLAAGCDPDAECRYKANCEELGFYWIGTPLHVAAAGDHDAAVRALIGHGATVDALGMLDQRRPLHYAAAKGAKGAVEMLLRAGADPSRPEAFHDQTPLHYAARGGHVDCAALLLRYGADAGAREGKTGPTALDLAAHFYIPEQAEALCRLLRSAVTRRKGSKN